jgi:hypothetical protein
VAHRQDGLEQSRDSGRGLAVAEVALDGADVRRRRLRVAGAPLLGEGAQLGGVADGGAGAVALEVVDGLEAEAGDA